ncbi:penicillin-binding protein 2 [Thiotrichales bacterium 19S3-7]|nr:penicillin-binding protein 2 [Thiotrichales bacterium 19S3-7]MCF6802704.1 penicillin-binding protein 2 [Thiotrichales bacterium 19S3-11]
MQDYAKQSAAKKDKKHKPSYTIKFKLPIMVIAAAIILLIPTCILISRIIYLDTSESKFLNQKANQEAIHSYDIHASRGLLLDRDGRPLAVSTMLYEVIFDIKVMKDYPEKYSLLAQIPIAGFDHNAIAQLIHEHPNKRYYIAAKYIPPYQANQIKKLHIPGIHLEKQMRTFYPLADIASQLVGFTNAKNQGQSGIELQYNNNLTEKSGEETIETDAYGNLIRNLNNTTLPHNGQDIHLSIDSMIQYFAYKALKEGVIKAEASSGSVAVINPKTGEVLAIASYPGFNPNAFSERNGSGLKNRAIVDTFEPGSTIKPFIAALALNMDKITPDTIVDTTPGSYRIQGHTIHDDANFGAITVTQIIQKSSNIGILKIEKMIPKIDVYHYLQSLGFGESSFLFPGINMGYLPYIPKLGDLGYATISFGYGMTSSVLQLAHAYTMFANNGQLCPLSLIHSSNETRNCKQILQPQVANEVLNMLNSVTNVHGTGVLASIPGYEVGGKTGTTNQAIQGGFSHTYYNAVFAGVAPLDNPKLVIVIWIDKPLKGRLYRFGGVSAAPIFAQIAENSLKYLGVPYTSNLTAYKKIEQNKQWLLKVIANN